MPLACDREHEEEEEEKRGASGEQQQQRFQSAWVGRCLWSKCIVCLALALGERARPQDEAVVPRLPLDLRDAEEPRGCLGAVHADSLALRELILPLGDVVGSVGSRRHVRRPDPGDAADAPPMRELRRELDRRQVRERGVDRLERVLADLVACGSADVSSPVRVRSRS